MNKLKGINLGCFLEYENTWHQEINIQSIVESLNTHKMNVIRLIVSDEFISDKNYISIINNILKITSENKIFCIITFGGNNLFSNESWISFTKMLSSEEEKYKIISRFNNMWFEFSGLIREYSDYLIIEPFNEIHDGQWGHGLNQFDDGKSYDIINMLNFAAIKAVEMNIKNPKYLIKPYCQQQEMICNLDKRLFKIKNSYIGAAFYGSDYRFSITGEEPFFNEEEQKNFLKKSKGLKTKNLLFTEIGCTTKVSLEEHKKYLDFLKKNIMQKRKYSYLLWDDGRDFKYINRQTGEFLIEI